MYACFVVIVCFIFILYLQLDAEVNAVKGLFFGPVGSHVLEISHVIPFRFLDNYVSTVALM